MARGNARATMMMTNALTGLEEDPLTYRDAVESPEKENWLQAIQEEYEVIMPNKIFEETKEPQATDSQAISSKWVIKREHKLDGSIRYKARLVIRGFEQTEYGETYN